MVTDKFNQLSHVHFEQQLWHKEIEMISHEVSFFDGLLGTLKQEHLIVEKHDKTISEFFGQIHHFQRLTKRLTEELNSIEKDMAEGVEQDNILDKEQKLDHKYFREEMDYLDQNYRAFKASFKKFIASTHFGRE